MKYVLICLAVSLIVAGSPERANAGLPGGRAIQTRHNHWADKDDLTRLQDLDELKKFIAQGHLVEITDATAYKLGAIGSHNPKHAHWYRYARSYVRDFLDIELAALHAELRYRFTLNSFVRTEGYQKRLCKKVVVKKRHGKKIKKQKVGGAICGKAGWQRSLHLTGAAFDISMKGMPKRVKKRLIKRLTELQNQGLIGAIIEKKSNNIHVFVRKAYAAYAKAHKAKKAKKASKKKKPRKKRKSRKHH